MPRTWTPEQKAAIAERMKQRWEARKNKAAMAVSAETQPLNPIATDVVAATLNTKPPKKPLPSPAAVLAEYKFSVADLIVQLENIPLGSVAYADCGLLLNALSACSTAVALARRQKQEQLDAGTHRAPCTTCGRMIDISKPGGFQILTERDEHWMPRNSYYCSQNCLLARNMPSHAKQTPKEKKENRA